jgi:hypothetical protein
MSTRTNQTRDTEERFVEELVSAFDVDTYVAYNFVRQLAAANLVVIDGDDLGTYRALVGAFKTISKIVPQ